MTTLSKKGWAIGLTISALILLFVCLGSIVLVLIIAGGTSSTPIGKKGVAVIHVSGLIASSPAGGILSTAVTATPESLIKQLRRADSDSRVAAVVLRIDSPGGSAAASQEIFEEVKRMKKPVVVSAADIDASGAYYISCGADEIMANRASEVGSIGVILSIPNLQELYDKVGVKYVTIKQGKYKDIGSDSRPMTDEEKQLLEKETQEIYEQFIADVASSRNIPVAKVREMATGMVWNGSKAKEMGLIDSLGNYQDAVARAGKLGKIAGEPPIIQFDSTSIWDILNGATSTGATSELRQLLGLLNGNTVPANNPVPQ